MTQHQRLLIIDFGSQVTQLIARRVREAGVYSEIAPFQSAAEAFERAAMKLPIKTKVVARLGDTSHLGGE